VEVRKLGDVVIKSKMKKGLLADRVYPRGLQSGREGDKRGGHRVVQAVR
jgi:hypothetical protein